MVTKRAPYPIHPGEILKAEVLEPLGMSINHLAQDLRVPAGRLSQIVRGQRAIAPDTSLRLTRYLGCTEGFWLRLQLRYDMDVARLERSSRIRREVKPRRAAA
jgi:addiction module HigA family antidote